MMCCEKDLVSTIAGFEVRGHKPRNLVFLEAGEGKGMNSSPTSGKAASADTAVPAHWRLCELLTCRTLREWLSCFQSQVYGNLLRQQKEIHIATQSLNSIPMLLESTPSEAEAPVEIRIPSWLLLQWKRARGRGPCVYQLYAPAVIKIMNLVPWPSWRCWELNKFLFC